MSNGPDNQAPVIVLHDVKTRYESIHYSLYSTTNEFNSHVPVLHISLVISFPLDGPCGHQQ